MHYFVKTPWWLKLLYPTCTWQIESSTKKIFLTFDDGPHPIITPFVLAELEKYDAKATFFCIGKNVMQEQEIYKKIIVAGHSVGNHTHNHLNGWKTDNNKYLDNIIEAKKHINSNLFRPPYGQITKYQLQQLPLKKFQLKAIMWTILSGDFDIKITPEKCLKNVITKTKTGSIIVFHDSEKAFSKLQYVLPKVLAYFAAKGYSFEKIEEHPF